MKKTKFLKLLSAIVCIVLIAAIALFTIGCSDNDTQSGLNSQPTASSEASILGEGEKVFDFTVTDVEGKETAFEIHTDEKTVGDALLKLKLIDGEEGPYGLYVKTVNSIILDYDKDGKYWAFYVDGKYATAGVESTEITKGSSYSFKAE